MKNVDLILQPQWIIPVLPKAAVYEDCAIVVHDGCIEAIVPVGEIAEQYQATETVTLPNQVVLPGLVNGHGHGAMNLLRGYADDLPLDKWLQEHIWPAEASWVGAEFVRDGSRHALAETLRSGVTCFSDMYFFPEVMAEVATNMGMRAQVAFPILEFPSAWGQGPDEYIQKGLALHDQYRDHSLIKVAFGPHAPYTVSDETFQRVAVLAAEVDAQIQVHLHETAQEVTNSLKDTGKRPIQRLRELEILGPRTQAVHMTQLTGEEIDLIAATNTAVIHCPKSNLKLASGFCPVTDLLNAGARVGLGTDGAASNNGLNMLEEMRFASLLAKGTSQDATALPAIEALEMATLGGARSLGMEATIGSLEVGKSADMFSMHLNDLHSQPLYHLVSQIVYAAKMQAENLWVAGNQLLRDGELTQVNETEILARAQHWATQISGNE